MLPPTTINDAVMNCQVTFFDVPLHDNFHRASKLGPRFDLRTIFNNTVLKFRPGDAITFVDNHECVLSLSTMPPS